MEPQGERVDEQRDIWRQTRAFIQAQENKGLELQLDLKNEKGKLDSQNEILKATLQDTDAEKKQCQASEAETVKLRKTLLENQDKSTELSEDIRRMTLQLKQSQEKLAGFKEVLENERVRFEQHISEQQEITAAVKQHFEQAAQETE